MAPIELNTPNTIMSLGDLSNEKENITDIDRNYVFGRMCARWGLYGGNDS